MLIPLDEPLRGAVVGDRLCRLRGEIELDRAQVGPRSGDVGPGRADVALIAVEEGHGHHHLREPLILRRAAHLPLITTHEVDVGDRLDGRPLERPLGPGDLGLRGSGLCVGPHDRLLQVLEVKDRQFLKQVGLEPTDVGAWQADRGGELPAAGLDVDRGIEQPHVCSVAFDAPEEHVGLRAFARVGELPADLV